MDSSAPAAKPITIETIVADLDNQLIEIDPTRLSLILAGEKLFATRGIDGVSLREVNQAAGQRNRSAAHYHFGTRFGLIEAIYDYRADHLNQHRLVMLQAVEASRAAFDLHSIIRCFVCPLIDEVENTEGGSFFLRFMASVNMHHDMDVCRLWRNRHVEAIEKIYALLRSCLLQLPDAIFSVRFGLMMVHLIYVMAEREKFLTVNANATMGQQLFYANLIDTLVAMMAAPISTETQGLIS
jgi:AcrR family transcriptional regulator